MFCLGSAYELELSRELTSRGVCSFADTWSTGDHWTQTFTAHAKICPSTGELIYIGYNLVPVHGPPSVTVGIVDPDPAKGVTHRVTVPVARASMQHDMGITASRTILVDGPLVFNLEKAAKGGHPFDFLRGEPLRFGVLPRKGKAGDVKWIDAECCFAYHGATREQRKAQLRCTATSSSQARCWPAALTLLRAARAVVNCWDDPTDPDRCARSAQCAVPLARI